MTPILSNSIFNSPTVPSLATHNSLRRPNRIIPNPLPNLARLETSNGQPPQIRRRCRLRLQTAGHSSNNHPLPLPLPPTHLPQPNPPWRLPINLHTNYSQLFPHGRQHTLPQTLHHILQHQLGIPTSGD